MPNNKWDVLEQVLNRYLGGVARAVAAGQDGGERAAGPAVCRGRRFRDRRGSARFDIEAQPAGAHAEAWIAAYRMTEEGRRFPGVTENLRWAVGLPAAMRR